MRPVRSRMSERGRKTLRYAGWAVLLGAMGAAVHAETGPRGLGQVPDVATLHRLDIAVGPRGRELPAGSGSVEAGKALYAARCAACHGASGKEGPDTVLVGGQGSLAGERPVMTIGSYWPYATTLFDYIRRAMPFPAPGSLTDDEVYALTAYLLHANGIVAADTTLDRDRLTAVRMPNHDGFVPDPRPDVP